MASTSFSRMIKVLAIVCLGLFSKVEAQSTHMGVEFMLQFPYMPEGQPILMMYSTTINRFDVYITAPKSVNSVFERVVLTRLQVTSYTVQRKYLTPTSSTTTSIVAKGKFKFGVTVFMAISFHSAASFLAIPVSGWGAEYFVLVPKMGPSIILISLVEENEISLHFTENIEQLESQFTDMLLSTIVINRKEAYIMQNCTGRTVGEQPLGFTPVKITALYSFGVIVGSCEEYEFESECRRINVKTAGGVTAEMIVPSRTWGKQFVLPIALKKSCEQHLRFLTHQPNTVILITTNEQTQVINVEAAGVLESYRLTSQSIVYAKASSQIMMYNDYLYPCKLEENIRFQELVMVVPVELFMNEYIWSTPSARGYTPFHYISVVAPIDNFFIVIDKVKISLKWKRDVINRWQTSFSRLEPGTHYMSSLTGVSFGLYCLGLTPDYQFIHPAGFYITDFSGLCEQSAARYNDGMDNDCDGFIDEERENMKDDDRDGLQDEDIASYSRTNLDDIALPLPPPVPPFVAGFLPADCPCPDINSCKMEMCQQLNDYIVCLESIVTMTNCDMMTRMEAMKRLRLKEIRTSSLSNCIHKCPTFLHNCIPSDIIPGVTLSCSQFESYLQCLKAVTTNPSCSRSFRDAAMNWIVSTENLEEKNLCLQEMTTISPEDWAQYSGKCLKLTRERKKYAEAVQECSSMDAELLTILDSNENLGASSSLTDGGVDTAYIAMIKANGKWSLPSSSVELSYVNWQDATTATDNSTTDINNCATIDKNIGFKWRPVPCTTEHSFICQKASCGTKPLLKSAIYKIEDKIYTPNSGIPALRAVMSRIKTQTVKRTCTQNPRDCQINGPTKCDTSAVLYQIDCFQDFIKNMKCSMTKKYDGMVMITDLMNRCYFLDSNEVTTQSTESTTPEGQTDFPIDVHATTRQFFAATESISTRDPGTAVTEVQTPSLSPGADCEDMYKVCEPDLEERIAWCLTVDNHWNCMKGLINTRTCSEDIRKLAANWMIENGRPLHCPPTTTTETPQVIPEIEDLICGTVPTCVDLHHYESICEEGSDGRQQLQCLNEIIEREFCFPKEAKSARLGRMVIVDKMLENNCEGLNYDVVELLKFEPDCEQCITLGMTTIFFYYNLKEALNANDQCNTLYFDYCNGDENECQKIEGWATACTFLSVCDDDFQWGPELRTHPIEAICNTWQDMDYNNHLVVSLPTNTFSSFNYRFRTRLSSDFNAFNKSAMVGVSRIFVVKELVDMGKAIVQEHSTNGAEGQHGLSIFWYIAVAALNVAALVTGV